MFVVSLLFVWSWLWLVVDCWCALSCGVCCLICVVCCCGVGCRNLLVGVRCLLSFVVCCMLVAMRCLWCVA